MVHEVVGVTSVVGVAQKHRSIVFFSVVVVVVVGKKNNVVFVVVLIEACICVEVVTVVKAALYAVDTLNVSVIVVSFNVIYVGVVVAVREVSVERNTTKQRFSCQRDGRRVAEVVEEGKPCNRCEMLTGGDWLFER